MRFERQTPLVWAVTINTDSNRQVVICMGRDREEAKREAHPILKGNADQYIVEPLTRLGDTVVIKLEVGRHL